MSSKTNIKELDNEMVSWYLAYYEYSELYDKKLLDQKEVATFAKDFTKSSMYKILHKIYIELLSNKISQNKCVDLCSSLLKVYFYRDKSTNMYKNINVSDLSFSEQHSAIYPINPCYSSINHHELEGFIDDYLKSGLYSKSLNILLVRSLVGIENTAFFLSEGSTISETIYHSKYSYIHKHPVRYVTTFVFFNWLTQFMKWFCKLSFIIMFMHLFASIFNEKLTLIQSIIFAIILNKANYVINSITINKNKMHLSMISLMTSISESRGELISTSELKHRLNYASEQGAMYPTQIYHLIELEKKNR